MRTIRNDTVLILNDMEWYYLEKYLNNFYGKHDIYKRTKHWFDCTLEIRYEENSWIDEDQVSTKMDKFIYLTSNKLAGSLSFKLKDLISRLNSLVPVRINNPSDDLFHQILTKMLSDKQINITVKEVNFILKKIERSYDAASRFVKKLDELSLLYKKKINIKIIDQALTDVS